MQNVWRKLEEQFESIIENFILYRKTGSFSLISNDSLTESCAHVFEIKEYSAADS